MIKNNTTCNKRRTIAGKKNSAEFGLQ